MTEHTRSRIIAAFERDLARSPVPPGLTAQVLRGKVPDHRGVEPHGRNLAGRRLMAALQGAGSLVAALLVVVLIATVLVGNRLRQDWNQLNTTPAPVTRVDPAQLAALRARPLDLPVLAAGATCPTGPLTTITAGPGTGNAAGGTIQVYGDGPAYMTDWAWYPTQWGLYWTMNVLLPPRVTGPVLIRAQDLQGGQPLVFVGTNAAGSVIGTGSLFGQAVQQHLEAVVDAGRPEKTVSGFNAWTIWLGHARTSAPYMCLGFQIDGPTFSETFVTFPLAGSNDVYR